MEDLPGQLSHLAVDIGNGVAVLRLDNPRRRNAINSAMVDDVCRTLDALEARSDIGAVVLTGAGPAFCAGAELGHVARAGDEPDKATQALRSIYRLFLRVSDCPLPTVAAINGAAVGAGLNLALACDIRIVSETARLISRFLDLGLHPGGGHTWLIRQAGGEQAAMAAVLAGQELSGTDAVRLGLAWRALPREDVLEEAVALASRIAQTPRDLLLQAKQTIKEMAGVGTYPAAVEHELPKQLHSAQQDAFRERIAALTAGVPAQ